MLPRRHIVAAAPSSSPDAIQPYHTIVIGLGSAGVTAASTLVKNGKRVLGLEAQGRVGGRVHTVPFGDGVVEEGAEWIHGVVNSRVYDLAVEHNVATKAQADNVDYYCSNGGEIDVALLNELMAVYTHVVDHPSNQTESLGTLVTNKLTEYITEKKPDLLKDQDFITELLALLNLATNEYKGSNDWKDVTTDSRYEELGGHLHFSWHRDGYKTFFDIMLNKYNDGPGLSKLDIKLNTEVTLITVPQHPEEKVVVKCKDGSMYEAEHVIVTVSLGVLKAIHSTSLFSAPLPKNKQTAIKKISMGVVDKIILSFDKPWWPQNTSYTAFIWRGEDKKKVGQADLWTTKIYGVSRPMGSSNTLTLWTSGDVAKEVELLPEDVVQRKSVELLQKFMGDTLKVTVPQPTGIVRSNWFSNPYTRGSYSFDNVLTPQYPDARAWLGAPLTDSAGIPRVLFAGEATNLVHFGTVHGASETGYREALRLLLGYDFEDGFKKIDN